MHQEFAERHTRLLPAGKGGYALVIFLSGKAQALEDAGHLAFVGVAVLALKSVQKIRIGGDRLRECLALERIHLFLIAGELVFHVDQILLDREDFLIDRPV